MLSLTNFKIKKIAFFRMKLFLNFNTEFQYRFSEIKPVKD